MTAEEKMAIELAGTYYMGDPGPWRTMPPDVRAGLLRLARHVLRRERAAVRRARGRTLGTVCVSKAGFMCGNRVHRKDEKPWSVSTYRPARVVAVPKPRKGGRE